MRAEKEVTLGLLTDGLAARNTARWGCNSGQRGVLGCKVSLMLKASSYFLVAAGAVIALPAFAKPIGPSLFCENYPDAPACLAGAPACTYCHEGAPPARNAYGRTIEAALLPGAPRPLSDADYAANLIAALEAAGSADGDGDGFINIDEITAGTYPGDDRSFPDASACPPFARNPDYDVCFFDAKYTFKKIRLDFCGKSPIFDEIQGFLADPDPMAALDRELDVCLDSEFWLGKNGQLWELAHRKIRPLQAIKNGEDRGTIPLADYYDDYNLFVYANTNDRDVRELLTATYFVRRLGTNYTIGAPTGEQDVDENRRAGLLTTRWNLVYNVMFTALPRTAAAQAYRSFLGRDIARLEGLSPIPGEPVDYDAKGVNEQETCRNCHSTLDPLSYPFKNYHGLTGRVGSYDAMRIEDDFRGEGPNIVAMPEAGYILGQPVANLVEWAQVAANSDEFASATVMDYWRLLIGREPRASEAAEVEALWRELKSTHNYSVEKMLHALIKTEAYGVP
jgi:hypothetical protein